jgi:integrase
MVTGCRRGELCSPRRRDADTARATLWLRRRTSQPNSAAMFERHQDRKGAKDRPRSIHVGTACRIPGAHGRAVRKPRGRAFAGCGPVLPGARQFDAAAASRGDPAVPTYGGPAQVAQHPHPCLAPLLGNGVGSGGVTTCGPMRHGWSRPIATRRRRSPSSRSRRRRRGCADRTRQSRLTCAGSRSGAGLTVRTVVYEAGEGLGRGEPDETRAAGMVQHAPPRSRASGAPGRRHILPGSLPGAGAPDAARPARRGQRRWPGS